MTRTLRCTLTEDGSLPAELPLEQRERTPWIDRWTFERGGKRWRVAVVPLSPEREMYLPYVVPKEKSARVIRGGIEIEGGVIAPTAVIRIQEPPIDPREWIESLGDRERWPEGTVFELVIEEVTT